MPIRFSTQAANADKMADDTKTSGAPEGMPQGVGADGTPRDKADRRSEGEGASSETKPGKDKDAAKP